MKQKTRLYQFWPRDLPLIRARRIELTKPKWAVEKLGMAYPPLKDSGGRRKEDGARTPSTIWVLRDIASGEKAG